MYDLVFLTNFPAFYKVRLYNRIAERAKILVVFLRDQGAKGRRNADFCSEPQAFESITLRAGSQKKQALECVKILRSLNYKELIIGGWDELPFWAAAFFSSKRKNAVVVESSYLESKTTGPKAWLKRIFLSRIAKAYCSGKSNVKLVELLGFRGGVVVTKGVGLYRRVAQPEFDARTHVKSFLYVGRLSPEKNLAFLIRQFNNAPNLTLNIVGFGPLETELKAIAKENIVFHGAVANAELPAIYQRNDVFVLPSIAEPWGMVVEEALNNGVPVLVSDKVGCAEEIVLGKNIGLIFKLDDISDFNENLKKICDVEFYNSLRMSVANYDAQGVEDAQIECYISEVDRGR